MIESTSMMTKGNFLKVNKMAYTADFQAEPGCWCQHQSLLVRPAKVP